MHELTDLVDRIEAVEGFFAAGIVHIGIYTLRESLNCFVDVDTHGSVIGTFFVCILISGRVFNAAGKRISISFLAAFADRISIIVVVIDRMTSRIFNDVLELLQSVVIPGLESVLYERGVETRNDIFWALILEK